MINLTAYCSHRQWRCRSLGCMDAMEMMSVM